MKNEYRGSSVGVLVLENLQMFWPPGLPPKDSWEPQKCYHEPQSRGRISVALPVWDGLDLGGLRVRGGKLDCSGSKAWGHHLPNNMTPNSHGPSNICRKWQSSFFMTLHSPSLGNPSWHCGSSNLFPLRSFPAVSEAGDISSREM